ncbi:FAD:protein FMN transferase, partial [Bifidobacterium amazonense]
MSELNERMPYVTAFPRALGTGLIVRSSQPIGDDLRAAMLSFIDDYERTLSRFRDDSPVTAMGWAEHGGRFDFPTWTIALFSWYDSLCAATDGAIDPCVGEDLIRLGYGADYTFTVEPGAGGRLGAIHGRPTWRGDVERDGSTLVTKRPVHLDFGACGKGYLVDLLTERFLNPLVERDNAEFVIDAGGDLLVRSSQPITIALEDPADTSRAVGTATIPSGAFCASAPSRRRWENGGNPGINTMVHDGTNTIVPAGTGANTAIRSETNTIVHHLLNAIDGLPVRDVAATWVAADTTMLADGLATALFVADPNRLANRFPGAFECALLNADRTALMSRHFPG